MTQPSQPIAVVAKITGLSVDTIRAWERRHRLVRPLRDGSGARQYSERDVQRIALAHQATRLGHSIGKIARLSDADLDRLIRRHDEAEPGAAPVRADESILGSAYGALKALDLTAAGAPLYAAALLLEPADFVIGVLAPLLRRIGEGWSAGEIGIGVEHAASNLVRDVMASFRRTRTATSRTCVLLATPPNELHDLGLQLAACLVAAAGLQAIVLGAQVPAEDVIAAVNRTGARAVVVSATHLSGDAWETYVRVLDAHLPARTSLWAAGPGADWLRNVLSARLARLPTLETFLRHFETQKTMWPA